ncbi:MerR family transcriptional regulator [Conyzicola nivalis]|uniref:MerR family transcriptional regulator n=1 Tax=Conyzicola nivalis TaxID=1477021 RepID=A0A916WH21_9MICO|nr:MerR family transcriptional regulator [Conyzicola nivalis]GGA96882.1 MerR family transcriptional regulator [Conyzicola nivalis]
MSMTEELLSISEVAEATGLTAHTLRYYERAGLMLRAVDRASSQHRRYTQSDVNWIVFLTRLRSTSMPIARMLEYVELVRRGDETVEARHDLLVLHRISVAAQLETITQSLTAIDYKITTYETMKAGRS